MLVGKIIRILKKKKIRIVMSCLFNSLARFVNKHPEELRKEIADYLRSNPNLMDDVKARDIIAWTENSTLEAYADRMSRPGVWGGAIEIKAFCEMYKMDIVVHVLYTGKTFKVTADCNPTEEGHISYTGNHFEPMHSRQISMRE